MNKNEINNYLDMAEFIAKASRCMRKKYGAILVSDEGVILSTGCNNVCKGQIDCKDLNGCQQDKFKSKHNDFSVCRSIHAEAYCVIKATYSDMVNGTMFLVGIDSKTGENYSKSNPCIHCKKLLTQANIEKIVIRRTPTEYEVQYVKDWEL